MGSKPDENRSAGDDTRRDFIRGSSLLLASALPGTLVLRPLRLGLLGCGSSGIRMAGFALSSSIPTHLVAIADIKKSSLAQASRSLKSRFGTQFSLDHEFHGATAALDLIAADLDAILIATPLAVKSKHLGFAIRDATPCYVEVPVAETYLQLVELQKRLSEPQLIGIGGRQLWQHRFALEEAFPRLGRLQALRFHETLRGSAHEDLLRARVQQLQLALSCCQASNSWRADAVKLVDSRTDNHVNTTRFNLGGGIVFTSTIELGHSDRSSFELAGTAGKCDLLRGRGWDSTGKESWRLSPLKSAKGARQQHMEDFLSSVTQRRELSSSPSDLLHLSQLAATSCEDSAIQCIHEGGKV